MPSVIPFRGDYEFHSSYSALKRVQEDMNERAHNIANANTAGYNSNPSVQETQNVQVNYSQNTSDNVVQEVPRESRSIEEDVVRLKEDEVLYRANAKTMKVQNDVMGELLDEKI